MNDSPAPIGRAGREARAIAALSHPHICTLHDVGRDQDVDYLVMELIDGRTLADRLRSGPLELAEALAYAARIADALAAAHRQGIVHRDLKPGNVMLARSGAGPSGLRHAKLLDFGLARLRVEPAIAESATVTAPLTGDGTIIGTLHYMAPEQLEGKPHDARVDVFAFGGILFEMITGRRAFDGTSAASIAGAVLHKIPPPITAEMPAAPPALERIVATCLAKDADDRWSSMHDVLLQLRAISLEEPTAPASQPVPQRPAYLPWGVAAILALVAVAAWIVPRAEALALTNRNPIRRLS